MVQEFLDPNSNINTIWNIFNFTNIDGGVRQPSSPSTDEVEADKEDDDEEQIWGLGNTTQSYGNITQIVVWLNMNRVGGETIDDPTCRIKVGGVWETAQSIGTVRNVYDWYSITFNGSWTSSEVDQLEVGIDTGFITGGQFIRIRELYCDVSGTAPSTGFTRKVKVSGTFADKPIKTKVSGTFVDKIIKIKVGGTFQDA